MNLLSKQLRNALAFFCLLVPATAWPVSTGLVISQVYGGGGNMGAPYTHDFIELHNASAFPVQLAGMAIQYAAAQGSMWEVFSLPAATVPAGGYYLLQGLSGGGSGMPLPAADDVMVINLGATAGKVALTWSSTPLTGSGCPINQDTPDPAAVDFVGYGNPDCYEASPVFTTSSATAAIRNGNGCTDVDNNNTDFTVAAPTPRNSASMAQVCPQVTMNETGQPAEADYCNLQFPSTISGQALSTSPMVFAQLYEAGVTEGMGASAWVAEIGYGPAGVNPATQPGYTWFPASFNTQIMFNDEYQAQFTLPGGAGTYGYTARFSPDGVRWTYCDLDGAGANMGLDFQTNQLGVMTVGGGGATAPSEPLMVAAAPGNGQATVIFSAPSSDGGAPITSYTVTSDPGGITGTGPSSPIVVAGLMNGQAYTFTVTATNVAGTGPASAPSNSVTPSAFAAGLVISQVYGGGGNTGAIYTHDFIELHNNTGSPISLSGLAVQYTSATGVMWSVSALPGAMVPAGGYYLIQGAAGVGNGMPLPMADHVAMISMNQSNGKVALTYGTNPIAGNGCPIGAQVVDFLGYGMTDCAETGSAGPTTNPTAAIRLGAGCIDTNNNSIDFTIATPTPRNSASPIQLCVVAPGAPTIGTALAGNGMATVHFTPPGSDGGSPITMYTATSDPGGISGTGASSPIVVAGLMNGQAYTFTVTATNSVGTGPASAPSNSVTPMAPTFTLTVTKAGTGAGTVTSSPAGIDCGATCAASFGSGAGVGLTATPAAGSLFTAWSGACTGTGACNVTMDAAKTVTATFDVNPNPPRLANISTRMQVLTGNDVMIGGFVIGGSANKTVAIVATGPSLAAFGITNPLANPTLRLVRSSDQATLATNDDWQTAANSAQLTAAGFAPTNALEAAILVNLAPGAYTAIVEGAGGGTGVAVVGVYEVDGPTIPLANISTRGRVLTGNDVMIGGFVIQGSGSQTVAIVATGPSLAAFGITNPLANPTISLVRSSDQVTLATNDDWQADAQSAQLQAAGFAPTISFEAGLYRTLPPGAYTVIVQGVGGGTGVAVIGVYRVN